MTARIVVAFALLVLAGCSHVRVPRIGDPPPVADDNVKEAAWVEMVTKYSDRAQIYDGLDTRLFVGGTWQAPAFVDARVTRVAEFQMASAETLASMLDAERLRLKDVSEVFLGMHVNDPRHDDFDRLNTIWRITLRACGKDYPMKDITRVGRASLNLRAIYPYVDTFWVAYRVRFPKVDDCTEPKVVVRIASTLGHAGLEFPTR